MRSIAPRPPRDPERGIALVVALLVVLVTSILAATFMTTATTERNVSSNVHIARGALLSADAGVRTAQQVLANIGRAKLDSLAAIHSGTGPVVTQPGQVFPAGNVSVSSANPAFTATATIVFQDSTLAPSAQTYDYLYTIRASGSYGSLGARAVQSQGILRLSAERGSFADYLIFTNTHLTPSGGQIWFSSDASFDGRVHSNGTLRFAYQPSFHDLVTQVPSTASFYNKGNPKNLDADNNGTIDVPNFYGGFDRGQAGVPLPANSFDQQAAALGLGVGSGAAPSNATINGILGTGAGNGTPPNGIYPVAAGGAMTGGLYVQGQLDSCTLYVNALGQQVYRMRQGGTLKIVTVDFENHTTSITSGASTVTYAGEPRGILYVNGGIGNLRGPDRVNGSPPPAIASANQLLITATADIVIQRDITYEDYNAGENVLGIYSMGGDVRIGTQAPNDMNLDAFVMAASSGNSFMVDNYSNGSPRGTFHLRGGMITERYGAFYTFSSQGKLLTGYARDFHYDRRGLVPPYFPTTNRFNADSPVARTLAWREM